MILDIIAYGVLIALGIGVVAAIIDSFLIRLMFGFLVAVASIAWAIGRVL